MFLARSEFDLYWLIAAAAYGVFAWWNDRRQKKAMAEEEARRAAAESEVPVSTGSAGPARPTSPEEERMRKFLEALGVPTGSQPSAPPPPVEKPQPLKPVSPTLAPRPVAMPVPQPRPQRPAPTPPVRPQPKPIPQPVPAFAEVPPLESREPASLETSFGQVSADFARMHDERMAVSTEPSIAAAATGNAPTTGVLPDYVSPQARLLREMLRDPQSIRAAVIVSEVLGPPKGA